MTVHTKKIGIMGAMPEEIDGIARLITGHTQKTIGMRTYHSGMINNISVVMVFSRWGKVAAATTVSTLIENFGVTEIIFTGVAGALHADLRIGDIVLGKRFVQHDMDARPIIRRFEIPLLQKTFFEADPEKLKIATNAISSLLTDKTFHQLFPDDVRKKFSIDNTRLFIGDVASGDQFFSRQSQKQTVHHELPSVLCVEMEGAAVAQVCYEHQIPFTIIRTISDIADDNAHVDFPSFIQSVCSRYSTEIIRNIFYEQCIQ